MGWAYDTCGGEERYSSLLGKPEGRNDLKELVVDGRMM